MPKALKSNIRCFGLAVPRAINASIIFFTHLKLLLVARLRLERCLCPLSYPLSAQLTVD
jgi:hypothetical protein